MRNEKPLGKPLHFLRKIKGQLLERCSSSSSSKKKAQGEGGLSFTSLVKKSFVANVALI